MRENKIPTPNWISIPSLYEYKSDLDDPIFDKLRPFNEIFLKPAEDGSSIDVFKLSTNDDLEKAIANSLNSNEDNLYLRKV